jgi:anti-sigma B factor antagonist
MAEQSFPLPDELDIGAVAQVRPALRAAVARGDDDLVVDCSELVFIDSTGVALLLEADRALRADGRQLTLVNVKDQPRELLEWLGLNDMIRFDREVPT